MITCKQINATDISGSTLTTSGNIKAGGTSANPNITLTGTSGNITCKQINVTDISGSITITGTSLNTNLIQAVGTIKNNIIMDNRVFNDSIGSIDLKSNYIGFIHGSQTFFPFDTSGYRGERYMAILPDLSGNFSMQINNIGKKLMYTDQSNNLIKTDWEWQWYNSLAVQTASIANTGAITGTSLVLTNSTKGSATYTFSSYYYNAQISPWPFGGTTASIASYSIKTDNYIICGQSFLATSDERIKTNIIDINDTSALAIIRQIQPKIYNYKDVAMKGDKPVWGFIAQQVRSVLEYSTSLVKDFIPDVYELAKVLDSNTIKLNTKTTVNFEVNKKIRLINIDGKNIETNITSILDNYTFTVEENISQTTMFVYGREVDDFHTLNKDAIFTVATAALQEVDKELQAEKSLRQLLEARLLDLENKNINLENKNINLENRFLDLESRIINLENKNTI
jgi:hypothetical protein